MRQGFWGEMPTALSSSNLLDVADVPTEECTGEGINNGSFPTNVGQFRSLWGHEH